MKPIACTRCGDALSSSNILPDRNTGEARGRCLKCKIWIPVALPTIHKKLVYLDQSFLSAACLRADQASSQNEVHILSKLQTLKSQQKIAVIISDVHSRETAGIPAEHIDKSDALWQFQNDLADGCISADWSDVFVAQQRRMLLGEDSHNTFPVADIGLKNPHQLHVGVSIQLTNNWLQRLDRANTPARDSSNDAFRRIFELQSERIPRCDDIYDCQKHVRELWREDIRGGIVALKEMRKRHQQMEELIKMLESGQIPKIPTFNSESPFREVVRNVVKDMDEDVALQKWLGLLEADPNEFSACVELRIAFEAELLWRWKTGSQPANSRNFNRAFGISRQNDITHISTFVPYVDTLTTDNDMRNLCASNGVAAELKKFKCKIFSKNNYAKFESWLDELLADVHHCEQIRKTQLRE
jgi:hypothetical protein